jgi:acetoin:2,6-dichlorophenolindophenol oxidoreductase subunit alpha
LRPPEQQRELLRRMLLVRGFEELVGAMSKRQEIPGFVHLSIGQEAVAVGVCAALDDRDRLTSTHRGHGHSLAMGCEVVPLLAELMGKRDGYCGGKGGSMHLLSLEHGVLGTNGIVAAGIPIAVGSALTSQFAADGGVTVAFFGDGAANEGVFAESLNMAAVWRLPVLFVCENNGFAEWTPADALTAGRIADRGTPLGIVSVRVDGNDVLAVLETAERAVARGRSGGGSTLIEAVTYRTEGHLVGEEALTQPYRSGEEVESWRAADPITRFSERLVDEGVMTAAEIEALRERLAAELERGRAAAAAGPEPEPPDAFEHVFAERP